MTETEAAQKTREWWNERANSVSDLPEIVGVGRYDLERETVEFVESTVVSMLSAARGRDVCLDGGCGVGLAFTVIHRVFQRVIGLDFSTNVIRRIPDDTRLSDRVRLCNGSITEIPLMTSTVDAVHCRDLMQCLPADKIRPMFQEFHRILRPGGVVVVHFKNSASMLDRIRRMASRIKRLGRNLPPHGDPLHDEKYVPGDTYLRPWRWCVQQAQSAGLRVEREFSWQLFFWGRLEKRGLARPVERLERRLRQFSLTERLIRHDGINYYLLLRRPE